jgi:hypothetical protein
MNDAIKPSTLPMELTQSNIQNIIMQNDNGEDPFNLVFPFVNNFIEKYNNSKNFNEQFINDSNKLFNLLYIIFNKQYLLILEEINRVDNTIEFNEKEQVEFELFKEFICNLKYICENISNIKNENEFSNNIPINKKINSTIKYLEKKNDDIKQLNKSMKDLNKSLENTYIMLKQLNKN